MIMRAGMRAQPSQVSRGAMTHAPTPLGRLPLTIVLTSTSTNPQHPTCAAMLLAVM